jgi:microcystin-dependent protein
MPLEDLEGPDKFVDALNRDWPEGSDVKSEGDNHLRGLKNVTLNSLPNITGAVTLTQGQINSLPADIIAGDNAVLAVIDALVGQLVGQIAAFPVAAPPPGWLMCIGGVGQVADYPTLAAYLGTAYGGDGVTTFGIPDYRGEFLRARDAGAGRNPDGNIAEGTRQAQAFLSHTHGVNNSLNSTGSGSGSRWIGSGANDATAAAGGNETRPRNIIVHFAIYAGSVGT